MTTETRQKLILVVDDEPDVITYLTTLLEDNGYATDSAVNGTEAMAKLRQLKPDLITLDISIPEKSGVRVYREMKEDPDLAHIPVLVITAEGKDAQRAVDRIVELVDGRFGEE